MSFTRNIMDLNNENFELEIHFKEFKRKTFIKDAGTGQKFSYGQFLELIKKVNLPENLQKIAVRLDNSLELAVFIFWALIKGKEIFFIHPNEDNEVIKKLIDSYSIDLFLTDKNFIANYLVEKEIGFSKVNLKKTSFFFLTSGTTGFPKIVSHSFLNFVNNGRLFIKFHNISHNDKFITLGNMTYMAGFYNMFILPFLAGAQTIIREPFQAKDAFYLTTQIKKEKISVLWLFPTIINMLNQLDRSGNTLEDISLIFSCTAPLNLEDKIKFKEKFKQKIFNTYGLSEVLFISSEGKSQYKEEEFSTGIPLTDVAIYKGSIFVKNPWLFFEGYLKENGILEKPDDMFDTKDAGFLKDNNLYVTGRKDEMIIRGGENISPAFLERKISKKIKKHCFIIGIKDKTLGEKVVCFLKQADNFLIYKVKDFIKQHKLPIDEVIPIEDIPLNKNMKVDKKVLEKMYSKLKKQKSYI